MPASESAPTALLGPRFYDAIAYAGSLHGRQVRKGTPIPYISHLLAVAAIVLEHGGNEDQAIAAVLHDAVEDQGGPPILGEIRRRFGEEGRQARGGMSGGNGRAKQLCQQCARRCDHQVRHSHLARAMTFEIYHVLRV